MSYRHRIIALVGIDGSGKTTQARWLARELTKSGTSAFYFENAGGRPPLNWLARYLGHADAPALFGARGFLAIESSVRFLSIMRAVLWARATGRVAIMDRYTFCEIAMIRSRGDSGEARIRRLFSIFPVPDLVLFMELPPAIAQERVELRGKDHETLDHLTTFRDAYRSLPEYSTFVQVNAAASPEGVNHQIWSLVGGEKLVR